MQELENTLEATKKALLKRDFEEEFEKIMAMDGILSVRILRPDNQMPYKLLVMTSPINQVPNDGKTYNIGAFDIEVNFNGSGRNGIRLEQRRDAGEYQHPHSGLSGQEAICFGNQTASGLNNDIDALAKSLQIAPMIHLVLTFLRKDSILPKIKSTPILAQSSPYDSLTPIFGSEEEREKEKSLFVAGMRDIVISTNTSAISEKIEEELREIESLSEKREKLRIAATNTEAAIDHVGSKIGREKELATQEIDLLMNNTNILWISAGDNEIQIHFDIFGLERSESVAGVKGYIVVIRRGRPMSLFYSSEKCPTCSVDIIFGNTGKLSEVLRSVERNLINIQSRGNFHELVLAVKNLIGNKLLIN